MTLILYTSNIHDKGRGVLTSKNIERDTVIERCPVILIPSAEVRHLCETELNNYYFFWGNDQKYAVIALGLGSIYNHSYTPNALYRPCMDEMMLKIIAIKTIRSNDEISFNYNGSPNDKSPLWDKNNINWIA